MRGPDVIDLLEHRNDEEFWMFFEEENGHTRIVANIPETLSDLPGFSKAFNDSMRRVAMFYGCRNYKYQTAFRINCEKGGNREA